MRLKIEEILPDINHAVVSVCFAPDDRGDVSSGVVEDHEGSFGEIEFHDGVLFEEFPQTEGFLMNEEGLRFLYNVFGEIVEEVSFVISFVEILDALFRLRSVTLEEAGLVLTHPSRDFGDGEVDALVHVLGLAGGIDDNMVGAKEDDFGLVPSVAFDIEDRSRFNNFWIVEVDPFNFFSGVFAQ